MLFSKEVWKWVAASTFKAAAVLTALWIIRGVM